MIVTKQQVRKYMNELAKGSIQQIAAIRFCSSQPPFRPAHRSPWQITSIPNVAVGYFTQTPSRLVKWLSVSVIQSKIQGGSVNDDDGMQPE